MKKKTIATLILTLLLAAVLCAGTFFVIAIRHCLKITVPNAYAVWWVADMVIEHMEANDGAWPSGWNDLRDDYEWCTKKAGRSWTFEELRSRVEVDWSADPSRLLKTAPQFQDKPFRVIWLRDGSNAYWAAHEPNTMILEYLKDRSASPAASQPATKSQPAVGEKGS
ncbi:MAG TPA: hypothetical protein DCX07_07465 [Phycisphaerales bacterium]|nr:hypothetical protein [Phycisphaerales bacterium]